MRTTERDHAAKCAGLIAVFVTLSVSTLWAQKEIRIATWNVKDVFTVEEVKARQADFRAAGKSLKPDILLLQEVTSYRVADAVRKAMGLKGYYVACSDFVQSDNPNRQNFEVAVISRYPFSHVIEYDATPDNADEKEEDPPETRLVPPAELQLTKVGVSRGFLWVSMEGIKMNIAVVHLKSSLGLTGKADAKNAQQREYVAAAVAASVAEDLKKFSDYALLVGGDFNVGHSDQTKNGKILEEDCYTGDPKKDGYDDTHALLSEGFVAGLRMKNLALGIMESTYPEYPGTPIDNIYVAGKGAERFAPAKKATKTFGSDHTPVWTTFQLN
jgi:endonuclease/exonuclease/phosphatase family metal-dependent hydrolase